MESVYWSATAMAVLLLLTHFLVKKKKMVSSQIFIMWGRINQTKEPKIKIKIYRAIDQTCADNNLWLLKNLHIIDIIFESFWKIMFNFHLVWPSYVNWLSKQSQIYMLHRYSLTQLLFRMSMLFSSKAWEHSSCSRITHTSFFPPLCVLR